MSRSPLACAPQQPLAPPALTTMNTINNNSNHNNNEDSTAANSSKMTTSDTHSIKIHFEGDSRDVVLPAPPTLAGLQAAVASTFSVDLPPHSKSEEDCKDSDLSFTYNDPDGDSIVFDKDSELQLALRLCRESLEIFAAREDNKDEEPAPKVDPEGRLYKIAARNLREYNGVPSMTPDKLTKTLALLKLSPRRLVQQGLAPMKLLRRIKAIHDKKANQQPLDGQTNEDLEDGVDTIVAEDKKEWNDGFAAVDQPAAAVCDGAMSASSDDEHDDVAAVAVDAPAAVKKNLLHKAFVDGGVQLRPREVRPLLLALAVKPCRLARLGLVDAKDLRAMLHAERKKANKRNGGRGGGDSIGKPGAHHPPHPRHHHPHHPGHRDMARGGPGVPPHRSCGPLPHGGGSVFMAGGGVGRGAGSRMMRGHHAHAPPPPPPHVMDDDDLFYAPADRMGGGRGRHGDRGGPHGPPPPPHHMEHGGMFYAHPPPPPPHATEEDDSGTFFVGAAGGRPDGRSGGRRGPRHGRSFAHPPRPEMVEEDDDDDHMFAIDTHPHPHQHRYSFAHGPPPSPPHMEENEEGMYGTRTRAGVSGSVRRGDCHSLNRHLHSHPHPHVMAMVEGGPGPHHGPPPGMMRKMRMRKARSAGGGGGQQVQHGSQYWG